MPILFKRKKLLLQISVQQLDVYKNTLIEFGAYTNGSFSSASDSSDDTLSVRILPVTLISSSLLAWFIPLLWLSVFSIFIDD